MTADKTSGQPDTFITDTANTVMQPFETNDSFAPINGGMFIMGSPESENRLNDNNVRTKE